MAGLDSHPAPLSLPYAVAPNAGADVKMPKTWGEMTQPEKIEDLRRDVVRIFTILSSDDHRISVLGAHVDGLQEKMKKAGKG
jgi:hypothetical protein